MADALFAATQDADDGDPGRVADRAKQGSLILVHLRQMNFLLHYIQFSEYDSSLRNCPAAVKEITHTALQRVGNARKGELRRPFRVVSWPVLLASEIRVYRVSRLPACDHGRDDNIRSCHAITA